VATAAPISPEEYLATTFEGPDRESVDGKLIERAMPNAFHGYLHQLIPALLAEPGFRGRLFPYGDTRFRVGPTRYRLPDIALLEQRIPSRIPDQPPLVVIEILSPEDSFVEMQAKAREYREFGGKQIWWVDPEDKV
jgi:Uma2 family endonuclease